MMKNFGKLVLITFCIAMVSACSDSDNLPAIESLLNVRVLHASPDAPAVNISVQGVTDTTEGFTLDGVDYTGGSSFNVVTAGDYDFQVEAIIPGGNAVVLELNDVALEADTNYDVIAIGKVADATLEALVISNPDESIAAGNFRAQVVHAAPDAPEVIVYVTAPGAILDASAPLGSFSFMENLGPVEVPSGDYQIRVALASDPLNAIFDSGTLPLADGSDLLITAVANTGTGDSPIALIAQNGLDTSAILDANTPANLRAVHAAPDAPPVDIIVNDGPTAAVEGLAFTEFTGYLDPAPGDYNIKVVDAPAPGTVVAIDADVTLDAGAKYTVIATGLLANLPLTPVVLVDNDRRIATEAKVRIVHASNIAGPVDVFVMPPGTAIGGTTPAIAGLAFQTETGFVSLPPGDYEVSVTVAGDDTAVAIDSAPISIAASGIYTAIAIDSLGGIAPVGLILMDDFVTP